MNVGIGEQGPCSLPEFSYMVTDIEDRGLLVLFFGHCFRASPPPPLPAGKFSADALGSDMSASRKKQKLNLPSIIYKNLYLSYHSFKVKIFSTQVKAY